METIPLEENIENIKILAKQMVKLNFGYEIDDLDQMGAEKMDHKLGSNEMEKITKNESSNNKLSITNSNKKLYRNEEDMQNLPSNFVSFKKLSLLRPKNENSNTEKIQEENSNIIKTNANLNTNLNTTTNLNSRLNTNTNNVNSNNNNISKNDNENNNNENDNDKNNDNDLYSEKNSKIYPINENSSNLSNSSNNNNIKNIENKKYNENKFINQYRDDENKFINQHRDEENKFINQYRDEENKFINHNKNDENKLKSQYRDDEKKINQKDENITVQIINPYLLKEEYNDSFDDMNINIIRNQNKYINNKIKKTKMAKSNIYERGIRGLQRKNKKLEKKREQIRNDELKDLRGTPEISPFSQFLMQKQEIYVPIDKRAAKLHSMKISQRILNEENNKIKKMKEDEEELKKDISRYKVFNQEEWDNFLENQRIWKNEIECKKKAAEIYRNNEDKKKFFKPKISNRSKSIIKDLQYGNDKCIDDVYIRLFNDFEEHKERQKLRNDQSLPSFKPKISKNSSQKNLNCKLKVPCRSGTTPFIQFNNNDNMKKKYSIMTTNLNEKKKNPKAKSEKLFCDLFNKNIDKFLTGKKTPIVKTTQGPTQPTDINTDLINSKDIILENPNEKKIIKNKSQNKIKSKVPFLPSNIKYMIEKNCELEEQSFDNSKIFKNNDKIKGITEKSNYQDGESHFIESQYYDDEDFNNIQKHYKESEEKGSNDLEMCQKDQEGTYKILSMINNNSNLNRFKSMNDFEKEKKICDYSQSEYNNEDSKFNESNLYKLNIRDSTPQLLKQDVILANKDFSDFFDIPDIENDI